MCLLFTICYEQKKVNIVISLEKRYFLHWKNLWKWLYYATISVKLSHLEMQYQQLQKAHTLNIIVFVSKLLMYVCIKWYKRWRCCLCVWSNKWVGRKCLWQFFFSPRLLYNRILLRLNLLEWKKLVVSYKQEIPI